MMIKETFEGEYIVDGEAFDDIDVFLDAETYLYKGIETRFGGNRNLEYLVNMRNKAMMVLEDSVIIFAMRMTELTKSINENKPDEKIFRYTLELGIPEPEYESILEAAMLFLEKIK
jgi:hypothetical protein